jgi:peptidoglycan-N-acetylglucosamine deacetylase
VVKPGSSRILEIPISAMIVPFIGTTMRVTPSLTRIVRRYLYAEARRTDKPIVFLFHPNECVQPSGGVPITRRTENPVEYLFADLLRRRLKLKNLGDAALALLDEVLRSAGDAGFEFSRVREYSRLYQEPDPGR